MEDHGREIGTFDAHGGVQKFGTGATRSADDHKHDYEGFLSPAVLHAFGEYMTKHRRQRDGKLRDSDNWQKGIPIHKYMKSLVRHTFDLWRAYRGTTVTDPDSGLAMTLGEICSAIMFNIMGLYSEILKRNGQSAYVVCDHTREAIKAGRDFSFYCPVETRQAATITAQQNAKSSPTVTTYPMYPVKVGALCLANFGDGDAGFTCVRDKGHAGPHKGLYDE